MLTKRLYYIPIEPLEERYTGEWYKYIPEAFKKAGFEVHIIDGIPLTDSVQTGTFLDINSTAHYKAVQLQTIAKLFYLNKIKNYDVFFIADLEFWGIEIIRYLADLQNIKVFIFGFLHAASYTIEDYMAKTEKYAKYFEIGWLRICDLIFVGSKYHRQAIIDRRILPYANDKDITRLINKIIVSGNPMFYEAYKETKLKRITKKNQIIISNRFDWEKRPNLSLDFAYLLKKRYQDLNIIITTSRPKFKSNKRWLVELAHEFEKDGIVKIYSNLTKEHYHRLLAESKVMLSNTIEENFGYCIAEALYFNTYPLIENKFSHPELVQDDSRLLFNDTDEILFKVDRLLQSKFTVDGMTQEYFLVMNKIIEHINNYILFDD